MSEPKTIPSYQIASLKFMQAIKEPHQKVYEDNGMFLLREKNFTERVVERLFKKVTK